MAPDRRKSGTDHKKHTDSSARPETGQEEKIFQTCLTGKKSRGELHEKVKNTWHCGVCDRSCVFWVFQILSSNLFR